MNHSVLKSQFDVLHKASRENPLVSAETRIDRLNRAQKLIQENEQSLFEAINSDFTSRSYHQTLMGDFMQTIETLKHSAKQVKRWMKPQKKKANFPFNLLGAKAYTQHQPKGVVGNISTWNFPVHVSLAPLAGVFAAGNVAMVKLSEGSPATSELMEELIGKYFDTSECIGVTGGVETAQAFCALPFDHLVFTGSTSVGESVLQAAAPNLTPVTLELGGKSPVIISEDCDLPEALLRILAGKMLNAGQGCISPDYLFIPQSKLQDSLSIIQSLMAELYPNIIKNPDYSAIINSRHLQRLKGYIDEVRTQCDVIEVNPSNETIDETATQKLPLTLIVNPPENSKVRQQEIFGPVFPILTYENIQETVTYINSRPRPLALYYFGQNKQQEQYIMDNTIAGSVAINDVMVQNSMDDLPFGGIGPSGMGAYHGLTGFKTFSHEKAIYKQSKINLMKLGGMLPPYTDKARDQLKQMAGIK